MFLRVWVWDKVEFCKSLWVWVEFCMFLWVWVRQSGILYVFASLCETKWNFVYFCESEWDKVEFDMFLRVWMWDKMGFCIVLWFSVWDKVEVLYVFGSISGVFVFLVSLSVKQSGILYVFESKCETNWNFVRFYEFEWDKVDFCMFLWVWVWELVKN